MNEKASMTALLSAFGRIYHAEQEAHPVFDDRKAKALLTPEEYQALGGYILGGMDFFAPERKGTFSSDQEALLHLVNTQIAPTPLARAAYCQEMLENALLTGTQQIVLLGAGLDTLAFRRETNVPIFEVDHPLTQSDKRARIQRAGWAMPPQLTLVPVDFAKDDLKAQLLSKGFDPKKKTFFAWLGVSFYLSLPEIEALLQSIEALSADGSALLFDFGDESLLTAPIKRVQNMVAMAAAGGEPMKTCFSQAQLTKLLEKHGMLIYELLTSRDIDERYFQGRDYHAFEHIQYCLSVVKRTHAK